MRTHLSKKKNYCTPLSESDSCVPKTHDIVQKILARREGIFHARLNASFSCLILYSNIFPKPHTYTHTHSDKRRKKKKNSWFSDTHRSRHRLCPISTHATYFYVSWLAFRVTHIAHSLPIYACEVWQLSQTFHFIKKNFVTLFFVFSPLLPPSLSPVHVCKINLWMPDVCNVEFHHLEYISQRDESHLLQFNI